MVIGYNVDIYNNKLFNSSIITFMRMHVRIYVECVVDLYILLYK